MFAANSGMMKMDKYSRHLEYALRKFWLYNGIEKTMSAASFNLAATARSVKIINAIGILASFEIRTLVFSL
jgi:hypothetical protein